MDQDEIEYGGVYRLSIGGKLVGEFVPGPLWTEFYQHAQETYFDVAYSWRAFASTANKE